MFAKIDKFLNSVPMMWVSGICLAVSFVGEYIIPLSTGAENAFMVSFAWGSIIISGIPLAYLAISRVVKQRFVSSALLITIAMIAAIYIGDIFAAGEVAFIMAIGAWLEDRTVEKAKKGIEKLLNLVPTKGRVITADGEREVDAKDIKRDDLIRVLPGESFPADGIVLVGNTTVDQSIMTGESLPVDKAVDDEVYTGTINRHGSVDVRVTKSFENSSLQKMIKLVEEAENNKAPMQKIVDKWATWLVPIAVLIAIATYLILAYGFAQPDDALVRAVTVLVVFCPCALALATPTSIMAAIGQATKKGVLIKSGEALERMGAVSAVAFDKTGTITKGKLTVSDAYGFDVSENELLAIVSTVESRSEHPIGKAVVRYAKDNGVEQSEISNFSMNVGKGVCAEIGGTTYYCGNEKLIAEEAKVEITTEASEIIDRLRGEGKAVIIAATNERIIGVVGLSDEIKDTSIKAIENLKSAGIEKTMLLTGDNEKSANFIAKKVSISKVYSSLLPEDKVAAIKEMVDKNEGVCMVGDGVNDAPALKTATVGVAMGTMGSDIAIDAADIAIMGDDISKISYIKKLSNATIFSIKFNIILSMAINFVAIILSVMGLLNPTTGALVHNVGSVLVVLNAARLYDKKID